MIHRTTILLALTALLLAFPTSAQDLLKVESVLTDFTSGAVVPLNLYLSDASGTVLGGDRGFGNTIQGISVTIQVDPISYVSGINFLLSGIAGGLTPRYETERFDNGNQVTWIVAFDEAVGGLSPTLDGFDIFGRMEVTLSGQIPPGGGEIYLTMIPGTTGLSNSSGSRIEPGGTGQLGLISGAIFSTNLFNDGFESGDVSAWSGVVP